MSKKGVKERILETATVLFYKQGTEHTGINQIIAESKVAKASFYQYFPSKETLILDCLDVYNKTIGRILRRLAEKSDGLGTFFKKWSRLLRKNAGNNTTFNGCPVANVGFQVDTDIDKFKEKFNEITESWYIILEGLFQKSIVRGEIARDRDFRTIFRKILHINEGALIMWKLTGKIEYIGDIREAFLELLNHTADKK